ncbi:glycogen/starch synthase, partial [Candidatus Omnitrophota bacterium]
FDMEATKEFLDVILESDLHSSSPVPEQSEATEKHLTIGYVAFEMPLISKEGKRLTFVGGKNGGQTVYMGDVPWAITQRGLNAIVVKPLFSADVQSDYGTLDEFLKAYDGRIVTEISVPVGLGVIQLKVISVEQEGVEVLLVYDESGYLFVELYNKPHPDSLGGYIEAIVLPRAAIEIQNKLRLAVDVWHFNDWQTALGPVFVKELYPQTEWEIGIRPALLFTTHNLEYQGNFPGEMVMRADDRLVNYLLSKGVLRIHRYYRDQGHNTLLRDESKEVVVEIFKLTGLRPELRDLGSSMGLEFWSEFEDGAVYGRHNLMKGAFIYSDQIVFVSNGHLREVLTVKRGYGLDGVLRDNLSKLSAVYNGRRAFSHKPENVTYLTEDGFSNDVGDDEVAWKDHNKLALQRILGLEVNRDNIIISAVTRIVKQKGLNVLFTPIYEGGPTLIQALMDIRDQRTGGKAQLIISGRPGDKRGAEIDRRLQEFIEQGGYQQQLILSHDRAYHLVKKNGAGSNLGLMPSIDEPGGLANQSLALLLMIMIVSDRGGLNDFYEMEGTPIKPIPGFEIDDDPESVAQRMISAKRIYDTVVEFFDMYSNRKDEYSRMLKKLREFNPDWSEGERDRMYEDVYRRAISKVRNIQQDNIAPGITKDPLSSSPVNVLPGALIEDANFARAMAAQSRDELKGTYYDVISINVKQGKPAEELAKKVESWRGIYYPKDTIIFINQVPDAINKGNLNGMIFSIIET